MLYVVPGHGQKSPSTYDPGAMVGSFEEAVSVRRIADALLAQAPKLGLPCVVDGEGWYHQRHARMEAQAIGYGRVAVVHLHHDASKSATTRHAMAMFDRRSKGGAALAHELAHDLALIDGAPWGTDVREVPVYDDRRSSQSPWLYRAYGCIDEVFEAPSHVSACLLELGFLTHPQTRGWLQSGDNVNALANAIARGALAWVKQ